MLTTNSCEVDVMLLIDMLTATMLFIQRDNRGCVKFPILPFSAFSWASRQSTAIREDLYLAVSRIQYSACVRSERQ